jgi:hypothetical protein
MPMNQKLAAEIADDITFAFQADEMGDCVTDVKLQIIKSTGEGITKADEETMFSIRPDHGNPEVVFGHAHQVTESETGDGDIDYLLRETNHGFARHLFTATGNGFDYGFKDNHDVDGNRELEDLGSSTPGRTYAQELSEDLDGFVLYFSHGLCDQGFGDREFDFVTSYVYRTGKQVARYSTHTNGMPEPSSSSDEKTDASDESISSENDAEKKDGDANGEITPTGLAADRLEMCIESMALVAHYVGGIDGNFDADEREEAANPRVLHVNREPILYDGNPDDDASIQAFIDGLSREDLGERLTSAIEEIDSDDLSSDELMDRMESLSEEAEELDGFLPLELEGRSDEEHRRQISEYAERYDLDVEVETHDEIDSLFEAFDEAIDEQLGRPFHVHLAYALVQYGTFVGYASGSLFSSSPYSDQEEEAVQDVGLTYGLPAFDLMSATMQAEMAAEAIDALTSKSFMEKLRDAVGL